MIAIYRTPADKAVFDRHYFEIHVPLAKTLPGLLKYEVAKGDILSTTGHDDVYCIGTLHFETMEVLKAAFASEQGRACAADRKVMAGSEGAVQIYVFDSVEV